MCNKLLSGLDEDVLEYVVGMLEGDEEQEEIEGPLADFLMSCEHCGTEEEAAAKCAEIFAALNIGGSSSAAKDVSDAAPKLLASKTSMADGDAKLFRAEDDSGLGGKLVDISEALDNRKKRKAEREAERRATKNMYERILLQRAAEEAALQDAVTNAVALRRKKGSYMGAVEAKPFQLPNPGGGRDLLENASFTLVRGRIYGLIGRNGKGKSTLLRALASRAVGDIPPELTVHYVSQEVQLSEDAVEWTPVAFVVHADVERRMLLAELAELNASAEDADAEQAKRLNDVQTALEQIESETAEARAITLLTNLGFSEELRGRKMSALSGGWRVRTALAAAIFARPVSAARALHGNIETTNSIQMPLCAPHLRAPLVLPRLILPSPPPIPFPGPAAARRADQPPLDWCRLVARSRALDVGDMEAEDGGAGLARSRLSR